MKSIAIISDIHGNLPALKVVLGDVRETYSLLKKRFGEIVDREVRSALVFAASSINPRTRNIDRYMAIYAGVADEFKDVGSTNTPTVNADFIRSAAQIYFLEQYAATQEPAVSRASTISLVS